MARRIEAVALIAMALTITHCSSSSSGGDGGHSDVNGDGHRADGTSTGGDGSNAPDGTVSTCFRNISCGAMGRNCGILGDGCGGTLNCGTCANGAVCGANGMAGVCGAPNGGCTPGTCGSANCGPVGDGCGNLIQCGTCTNPDICGGGGPNICGAGSNPNGNDGGTGSCTGLCTQIQACSGGATTTITGTVKAPSGVDPIYNALVYIPNAPVQSFSGQLTCDVCGAAVSGAPLVSFVTGPDGTFTLTNAPSGTNIPLVIQLGHWRRQVVIPTVNPCTANSVDPSLTHLPQDHTQGDIPLMAMVTGNVDSLECVLRKIGIADSEFTTPTNNGRVQFYIDNGADAPAPGGAPMEESLVSSPSTLGNYDMVLFACHGAQVDQSSTDQQNVIDYANMGGRVFATHFSYVWLYDDAPFENTATWNVNGGQQNSELAFVDQTFTRGQAFAQWLQIVGASTTPGQITINQVREDFSAVTPPAQQWLYWNNCGVNTPLHYTFNTPVGATDAQTCGRVLFSDFHVSDAHTTGMQFPDECTAGGLTAQERVLEFMLFDLASCVPTTSHPMPTPQCQMTTCQALGAACGMQGDGCGGTLDCGMCPAGQTCGGGGVANQCGAPSCTAQTCQQLNATCGMQGDGCGGVLNCGMCPTGQLCGGAGTPNQCGING